jgi:hypothetical protein
MLDDRGLTSLQTSTAYGNFQSSTLTQRIQSWINQQRTKCNASSICRDKNQYRIFFSDRYVLYVTFEGNKLRGVMPCLYTDEATCVWTAEKNDGTEVMFFGTSDGYVMQMDKGTSFDGDEIEAFMYLAFDAQRMPRQRKRYKHAQFEIQGDGYAEFRIGSELGYASSDISQPVNIDIVSSFSAGRWDVGNWDTGVWDGRTLQPSDVSLTGTAENISLIIYSNSDYFAPTTMSGVLMDYTVRRSLR